MNTSNYQNIVIVGPTGSGKSRLALALAERISGEIISCDSVQVYRYFDIGSAKPSLEERTRIRHHLIDIVEPNDPFDAVCYAKEARQAIIDCNSRGNPAIIVGGTGLYLFSLMHDPFSNHLRTDTLLRESLNQLSNDELLERLKAKDPERATKIHPNDKFRLVRALEIITLTGEKIQPLEQKVNESVSDDYFVIKIFPLRHVLHENIAKRSGEMISDGLLAEVEALMAKGFTASKPMQSIGYKQVGDHLQGLITREEIPEKIIYATRQYAKRQYTWFKKLPHHVMLETPELTGNVLQGILKNFSK